MLIQWELDWHGFSFGSFPHGLLKSGVNKALLLQIVEARIC
jgi:hypothetical protein